MSKKVVIVIVEGNSDEELLITRLRELFSDKEIRFEPQFGDVLYEINSQSPIKAKVGDIIKGIIKKRKYKPSDILAVLHIMDTDGCFIDKSEIKIDPDLPQKTFYNTDHISVIDGRQEHQIIERNDQRSRNIKTLNSISSIVGNRYRYQIYYFSRNLEHVIFNDPNPEDDYKCDKVEFFLEDLEEPIETFLSNFIPVPFNPNYQSYYNESWNFIEQGTNSLNRFTNIPLLIKYIEGIAK